MSLPDSITCPRCHRTSYNPTDVREGYCGNCHDWTGTEHPGDAPVAATRRPSVVCGAGNALALTQRLVYEHCTLPAGHPEWVENVLTGYSYNHCNVEAGSWWNDSGQAPPAMLGYTPVAEQADEASDYAEATRTTKCLVCGGEVVKPAWAAYYFHRLGFPVGEAHLAMVGESS